MYRYPIEAKEYDKNLIDEIGLMTGHSIFNNSLNLISQDRLIYLGRDKNGKPPNGIILDGSSFNIFKDNFNTEDNFRLMNKKIFGGKTIIYLGKSTYDSQLGYNLDLKNMKILNILFEEIIDIDKKGGFNKTIKESFHSTEYELVNKLLNSKNNEEIEKTLELLIGRGIGLTPSGDDMLLGLLYTNRIKNIMSDKLIKQLKDKVLQKDKLTTDVSISYYKYAFDGRFNSQLIKLYEDIERSNIEDFKEDIKKISDYGHTSGIDLLSGIAYGLKEVLA